MPNATLNVKRQQQFLSLMEESGWDLLFLYGHSWRKDHFRSLVNFNFFGPHAMAVLNKAGEIRVLLSHPWDHELLGKTIDAQIHWSGDFRAGLDRVLAKSSQARI